MKSDRKGGYTAPKSSGKEMSAMRPGMGCEKDLHTGVRALENAHKMPDIPLDRTNLPKMKG